MDIGKVSSAKGAAIFVIAVIGAIWAYKQVQARVPQLPQV